MKSLADSISNGDELDILKATRNLVAEQLEISNSGRDIAALSKQMQELTARISELQKQRGSRSKQSSLEKARKAAKRGR